MSKNPTKITEYYQPLTCKDSAGNEYICLNAYEAKAVANLIETLKNLKIDGVSFNTGDWFYDVPFKINKWLQATEEGSQ